MRTARRTARRTALIPLFVAIASSFAGVPAAHAAIKSDGLSLVVPVLAPMMPGQQGWVSALWTADQDVCDVQVTASGQGLTTSYPTNTGAFTSLFKSSSLATGNLDFTALHVTVDPTVTSSVPVTLNVSYTVLAAGQIKPSDDLTKKAVNCKGSKASATVTTTLPIVVPTGPAVVQQAAKATVSRSTPSWADISYLGDRPGLSSFHATLTPPKGLVVSYPGDRAFAGLNDNDALPVGQLDHVSVRLDASGLAAGSYTVPVRATYTGGSLDGSLTLTVQ